MHNSPRLFPFDFSIIVLANSKPSSRLFSFISILGDVLWRQPDSSVTLENVKRDADQHGRGLAIHNPAVAHDAAASSPAASR